MEENIKILNKEGFENRTKEFEKIIQTTFNDNVIEDFEDSVVIKNVNKECEEHIDGSVEYGD